MKEGREDDIVTVEFSDLVETTRMLGVFFLSADYSKFALGFFQLASMAELAIFIR